MAVCVLKDGSGIVVGNVSEFIRCSFILPRSAVSRLPDCSEPTTLHVK